jgi:hypothetical protein
MFRLASLLALAGLTLATAALLTAHKTHAEEARADNELDQPQARNRLLSLTACHAAPFHARFSLN